MNKKASVSKQRVCIALFCHVAQVMGIMICGFLVVIVFYHQGVLVYSLYKPWSDLSFNLVKNYDALKANGLDVDRLVSRSPLSTYEEKKKNHNKENNNHHKQENAPKKQVITPPKKMLNISLLPPPSTDNITTTTALGNSTTEPRLWIQVGHFKEGIANWHWAFAEVVAAAKVLNATLVLPCIFQGSLMACHDNNYVEFSQLFRLDKLREFHPLLATARDVDRLQNPKVYSFCLSNKPDNFCHNVGANVNPSAVVTKNYNNAKSLDNLLQHASAARENNQDIVLDIAMYRREGFMEKTFKGNRLAGRVKVFRIVHDNLVFHPHHENTVYKLLNAMGISKSDKFHVIHWRAELPRIDYQVCAQEILNVRNRMNNTHNGTNHHHVVLISSLSKNRALQWIPGREYANAGSNAALDQLAEAGLKKIDSVLSNDGLVPDVALLATWDLIMAQLADEFATCTNKCGGWCAACGHRGVFAKLALQRRSRAGKETHECWPA